MAKIRKEILLEDYQIEELSRLGEPLSSLVRNLIDKYLEDKKTTYIQEIKLTENRLEEMKDLQEKDISSFLGRFEKTMKRYMEGDDTLTLNPTEYLSGIVRNYSSKTGFDKNTSTEYIANLVKELKEGMDFKEVLNINGNKV